MHTCFSLPTKNLLSKRFLKNYIKHSISSLRWRNWVFLLTFWYFYTIFCTWFWNLFWLRAMFFFFFIKPFAKSRFENLELEYLYLSNNILYHLHKYEKSTDGHRRKIIYTFCCSAISIGVLRLSDVPDGSF